MEQRLSDRLLAGDIIEHFAKLNNDSPGTWSKFVIACAGLDDTLRTIHNSLERYRSAGCFYTATDSILAETRATVARQIDAARLPVEFVLERVTFEPSVQPYNEDKWVYDHAVALLQRNCPGISYDTAEDIYFRLAYLVSESAAKSIERLQVKEIIDTIRASSPREVPPSTIDLAAAEDTYRQRLVAAYSQLSFSGFERGDLFLGDMPLEKVFARLSLTVEKVVRETEDGRPGLGAAGRKAEHGTRLGRGIGSE